MNIITGVKKQPAFRAVVYGVEGLGKTTLAAKMPKPLFIDLENGSYGLDVANIDIKTPMTFENLMGIINELSRDNQGYKTLVIDSLDVLEKHFAQQICDERRVDSIEDVGGWGKGFNMVAERFAKILDKLWTMAERGQMNVVLIGHSQIKTQTLPDEVGAFDKYELTLAKSVKSLVKSWCDTLIFLNYRIIIVDVKGEQKKKAQGGKRWAYTQHRPAFDAKHRVSLDIPDDLDLDEATKILAKAFADVMADRPKPVKKVAVKPTEEPKEVEKPAPANEYDPTSFDPAELEAGDEEESKSDTPEYIQRLRTALEQYDISDEEIEAYAAPKLKERTGLVNKHVDQYPERFCEWLIKGMHKIAVKIKGE